MSRWLRLAVAVSLAVPGGFAAPAFAQYSARSAESMCRDTARREYGTSSLHGLTTSDRGRDRYTVTGHAQRSGETAYFTCKVEDGRIRDFNRGSWNRQSSGGGSNAGGAVAAVGAAVLLGAVIAAATSKKKSHEYDRYDDNYNNNYNDNYNNYYAANNSRPYDENRYRGERYSPVKGITCYRQQRACFEYDQNYSANWTSHEFGY